MRAPVSMKIPGALLLIAAVRLASVPIVQTWYVPDEYWQSLEVAHKLSFGYGHLTWEWTNGIRSYIYPAIIAGFYKLLELVECDHSLILIFLPRILQAILSTVADYSFYKWTGRHKWGLFMILIQWFWFYTANRTLSNSVETALIMIALARYPFETGKIKDNGWLCIAALSCVIRPTAAIVWFPFCLKHILTTTEKKIKLIALYYIPIGLSIFGLSTMIDTYLHGGLIITPWEFFKVNYVNDIGSHYGSQPWYWYFAIGFPAVLGINLIPFLCGSIEAAKNRDVFNKQRFLLFVITFVLAIYSLLPHKEFRFILPLVPMATYISQDTLSRWSRRAKGLYVYLAFAAIIIGNIVPIGYLGVIHQRGVMDVMPVLRDIATKHPTNTSLLFLMPCHSTPLYSHLHVNVPVRFLTCEPNLYQKPNYKDEADMFYENPIKWFQIEYLNQQVGETVKKTKLPSHIILFDKLVPQIGNILAYYNQLNSFFHSEIPDDRVGKTVTIYEREVRSQTQKPTPNKVQK
ncbi:phosphatidylinositol glycan anchor biosynthesis class B [Arctopsyche grandis]|uniref:phosphatidylinositol glycan anchor biosynthesis class B n=1 Tax=Arctopsyche grandis TaxID=121162 RepID=UPI00406D9340